MGTSFNLEIDFEKKEAHYNVYQGLEANNEQEIIPLQQQKIQEFIQKLADLDFYNWRDQYEELFVLDGTTWSVLLKTKQKIYTSSGTNAYPDSWDQFCNAIETLIDRTFH